MRGPTWLRSVAFTAVLLTACTSVSGPAIGNAASRTRTTAVPSLTTSPGARPQCAAIQRAPEFPRSASSTRNLALVTLRGSDREFVVDLSDVNHPFAVATVDVRYSPRFASPTDLSFSDEVGLFRMPFSGSPKTLVIEPCNGIFDYTWSRDGTTAAYVTDNTTYGTSALRLVGGGQDRLASSMPPFARTGCESQAGCERLDVRLLYSPNGAYISLVNSWPGPAFRTWTSEGKVVTSANSGFTTWSVWSGNNLYFRDDKGVEVWRDGVQTTLLPGVAWIGPRASPAGGKIVYQVRDNSGTAHVELLDTSTGTARELASERDLPAFLTSRYVWYEGERLCVQSDNCGSGYAMTVLTGHSYIYDVQNGTEVESIITRVDDVWPHPA